MSFSRFMLFAFLFLILAVIYRGLSTGSGRAQTLRDSASSVR